MSEASKKVSPIVAIAAVSLIIFSAVGVGVMTGIIPSSISKSADAPAVAEAPKPVAAPAPTPAPAEKPRTVKRQPASEPARVASSEPTRTAQRACTNCGSVVSVDAVKQKGEGSGLGAIGGAVVGGVLGNQVGRGSGRTAATVVGAGAGAYAGHEIEKHVKSTSSYVVAVRMDDGSSRSFGYDTEPAFRAGDKVRVVEGRLVAN
jgi:outer membrane lipoprotein SlyB